MHLSRYIERVAERVRRILGPSSTRAASPTESAPDAAHLRWSTLIAHVLGAGLLAAAFVLIVLRATGAGTPRVVVFDIIRYANAQRAIAARFVSGKGAEEAVPLLLEVSRRTRTVIHDVAGANTLVVIRQAVVQGETRDITDEVLRRLGLPTDVPTADPTRRVLDIAPTLLGAGPRVPIEEPPRESPSILP